MNTITITRWKVARSRFATGFGFAWKWHYTVTASDGTVIVHGADMLAIARRMAKDASLKTGEVVVEGWKK